MQWYSIQWLDYSAHSTQFSGWLRLLKLSQGGFGKATSLVSVSTKLTTWYPKLNLLTTHGNWIVWITQRSLISGKISLWSVRQQYEWLLIEFLIALWLDPDKIPNFHPLLVFQWIPAVTTWSAWVRTTVPRICLDQRLKEKEICFCF